MDDLDDQVTTAPPSNTIAKTITHSQVLQREHKTFRTAVCILLLGLWFSRVMCPSSSSSLWEPEPPCFTWDWLHQTSEEGPALPVSMSLLGHLEASQVSESAGTTRQVLSKCVESIALFSLESSYAGDLCQGNPTEDVG